MSNAEENQDANIDGAEAIKSASSIYECLASSKYTAVEIVALLQINNLLEMRLMAYSEFLKNDDFEMRGILLANIQKITMDLRFGMALLGITGPCLCVESIGT